MGDYVRFGLRFSSKSVALVGVFAALHAVLYLVTPPGLWRNWSIYLEPLEGIILGPWVGFLAALMGSIVARAINPTELWMFGVVAEPFGVLASGLVAKRKWRHLAALYGFMLGVYFVHPLGRWLPMWTILDILASLALIYPISRASSNLFEQDLKRLSLLVPLIAFVGTATDALTRIFLLIPVGLHSVFLWSWEAVYIAFIEGASKSYIEDVLVVVVSFLAGVPLLVALRKIPGVRYPLS